MSGDGGGGAGAGPPGLRPGTSFTRLDLDAAERFVRLGRELGVSAFGVNLLLLRRGQRMRIHRHRRQEEVYLVLEGTLSLLVEGEERALEVGEVARIAPGVRRQLANPGSARCAVLCVGGAEPHDGRDAEAFGDWADERGAEPRDVPLPDDLGSCT